MISWLTRKLSGDQTQLGLFDSGTVVVPGRVAERGQPATTGRGMPAPLAQTPSPRLAPEPAAAPPVRDPAAFLTVLQALGLRGVREVKFTRNRRTMVSLAGGVLRVHEAFTAAPREVLQAIATFATTRTRARRTQARDIIVGYPIAVRPAVRRPAAQHEDDLPLAAQLTRLHEHLNQRHFDATLTPLEIHVSRRLARRLGHYTPRSHTGTGVGEIVISRKHIKRDGWTEAAHTLLHEMVHQWQDETGRSVDHGPAFRAKCRAVGIEPAATRLIVR